MTENPVLEEVATQEEARELAEKILDHMASGGEIENFDAPRVEGSAPEMGEPSSNGSGDIEADSSFLPEHDTEFAANADAEGASLEAGEELAPEASRDPFEEVDFGREFQDYLDPGYKTQEFEYKEDAPTFEQFLTKAPSLNEHLEWQLHMDCAEGEVCEAAECVIGNLHPEGRLTASNEEISALGGWSEEVVEQARAIVMRLEPIGCGARDVRECLLAQLEARGETERLAVQLIRGDLGEVQQHKEPDPSNQNGRHPVTL